MPACNIRFTGVPKNLSKMNEPIWKKNHGYSVKIKILKYFQMSLVLTNVLKWMNKRETE